MTEMATGAIPRVNKEIAANTYTFTGTMIGDGNAGDVLFLHGFPYFHTMFFETMEFLAKQGFRCFAFDQRGYSAGAKPDDLAEYYYDKFRDDVWAVATAVGFSKFHLVGHDHGALLGWYSTCTPEGKERLLSFTALSVPHPTAYSAALYGPQAVPEVQIASQYWHTFLLPDACTLKGNLIYNDIQKKHGNAFPKPADLEKAMNWIRGSFAAGVLALPPRYSACQLCCKHFQHMLLACVFGRSGGDPNGSPQKAFVPNAEVPVLLAMGANDIYIKVGEYAKKSEDFCSGAYTYLETQGSHDILEGPEAPKVQNAILKHLKENVHS